MPALSTFVTTLAQTKLLPKVVDNVLNGNVVNMRLLRNSRTWNGGTAIEIPINIIAYTSLGSYFGFDTFNTTQQTTRVRSTFNPSQYYVTVNLSGIQLAVNRGEEAVLDLVATELEQRGKDLSDSMGTDLYLDGTSNSSKAVLGLGAAVDDSTDVTVYGNISRATYTTWRATRTAQSGSLSLANLAADFDAAQIGSDLPTLMVCPPAVWTIYESLLTPTVSHMVRPSEFRITPEGSRPIDNLGGNQGFRALAFRGIPVVSDEKCTANNLFTLNENHLQFYNLPAASQMGYSMKNGFIWTGFRQPVNQDAVSGFPLKVAAVKSFLINLGNSNLTRILAIFNFLRYYGKYENPQQAKQKIAVAETERKERIAFCFA